MDLEKRVSELEEEVAALKAQLEKRPEVVEIQNCKFSQEQLDQIERELARRIDLGITG